MRTFAIIALLVGACGKTGTSAVSPAFSLSTPTREALTVTIDGSSARDTSGPLGEETSKNLITELDARVADLVGVVEMLVAQPAEKQSATQVVWVGASGGLLFRFTMNRGGPNRFGWLLEAHNETAADSTYTTVLAGGIRRGSEAHRGSGYFALDYDHYAAAAAGTATTVSARGLFGAVFVQRTAGTLLAYALKNYTSGPEPAHSAFYQAVRVNETVLHPALAFYRAGGERDVLPEASGETPANETVVLRARHAAGSGGWARGVVFGGNAPVGRAYLFRECWSDANAVVYRRVWACSIDASQSLSDCHFKSAKQWVQVGGLVPSDGAASNPDGALEKETLRRLCFSTLGASLAAAALAEPDPPASADDTSEDVAVAGAPSSDTPTSSDSVSGALTADGSAPGI